MRPAIQSKLHTAARSAAPGAAAGWRRLPRALLDLLLPRECALCESALDTSESPAGMCMDCAAALPGATAPRCACCGLRGAGGHCPACLAADAAAPPAFTAVCCDYGPPADRLVTAFKYGRRIALGRAIGAAMARRLEQHRLAHPLPEGTALVAVPIAPSRLARRGFDQAAVLARQVGTRCGMPIIVAGLVRTRDTRPQPGLARGARGDNLHGAMAGSAALAGRALVLVDDVITTGATIREAERAARAAGGEPLLHLAFARTPAPGMDEDGEDAT